MQKKERKNIKKEKNKGKKVGSQLEGTVNNDK